MRNRGPLPSPEREFRDTRRRGERSARPVSPAGWPAAQAPPGLTLLELLIVMAVLATLAALLLPMGGRAIEEARMVDCRNHLRNLGLAITHYADAHEGALPVSGVLDGPHPDLVTAVAPYLGDERCWYCPSETDPAYVHSEANLAGGRIGYFYYACERATRNAGVSTFLRWSVCWPRHLTRASPAATWVMSDRWFSGEPTAHAGYKKAVNYLTVDGRVDAVFEGPRSAFQ